VSQKVMEAEVQCLPTWRREQVLWKQRGGAGKGWTREQSLVSKARRKDHLIPEIRGPE
jgi:hypothetical protein